MILSAISVFSQRTPRSSLPIWPYAASGAYIGFLRSNLSIIAADDVVKGVSVEDCKYPLDNAKLTKKFQYAVSNEIEGNCALISVKKGGIYIVESRDLS